MRLMSPKITLAIFAIIITVTISTVGTFGNPAVAQNATSNMTGGVGNVTSSSTGEAKMHLDEGIKVLQSGDTNGAMMHLKIAQQKLTG